MSQSFCCSVASIVGHASLSGPSMWHKQLFHGLYYYSIDQMILNDPPMIFPLMGRNPWLATVPCVRVCFHTDSSTVLWGGLQLEKELVNIGQPCSYQKVCTMTVIQLCSKLCQLDCTC